MSGAGVSKSYFVFLIIVFFVVFFGGLLIAWLKGMWR